MKKWYASHASTYHRTSRLIHQTEYRSREEIETWQTARIKKVLTHAFHQSPFYQETFHKAGVDPSHFASLEDIQAYPFLTKARYRDNIGDILSRDAVRPALIRTSTGGTTGEPLPLYRFVSDFAREKAFIDHVYKVAGMDPACRRAVLRMVVGDRKGVYQRIGDRGRSLYLSSHNMSDANLAEYTKRMRDFQPQMLYTLPSVAMILAGYMERNAIPPFGEMKWVFCTSENLYDFQAEYLKKAFRCRITSFYGHAEHGVMASKCAQSDHYHVFPQYGYTELIDEEGRPVTEEGAEGEIVTTAFSNACCPLIRYRTGDYAVLTREKCGCGREYVLWKSLRGREPAVAIARNSARVSIGPALLCTIFDKTYTHIKQFQIVQDQPGALTIKFLPHDVNKTKEINHYFRKIFDEQFPDHFHITTEQVDESEFKKNGKHRYFIQNV